MKRQLGLSLIEVIVALVVISGFGAALFVWAGQTLQTASRAASAQQAAELERNITELAYSLNPIERPEGELLTPTHRYRWLASLERGPSDQVRQPIGLGIYQISLFKLRFTVTEMQGNQPALVSERVVAGYKQVRIDQSGPPGMGQPAPPRRGP